MQTNNLRKQTPKQSVVEFSIKIYSFFAEHPLKRRATRRARSGSVRRTGSRHRRSASVRSGSQCSTVDRASSVRRPNGLSRTRKKSEIDVEQTDTSEITSPKRTKQKQDLESGEAFVTKPPEKSVRDQIYNIFQNG